MPWEHIAKFIMLVIGGIGGFYLHHFGMKVSFKQRTIENKIKVYDALITHWVKMRNFIYAKLPSDPFADPAFDAMYGESQAFIGEAVLVSEDTKLTEDINVLNEKFYRTNWINSVPEQRDEIMEGIKIEAMGVIKRMREDIKASTKLRFTDLS